MRYSQANTILNSYIYGQLSNGIKFEVALNIVDMSIQLGDKVLLFRSVHLSSISHCLTVNAGVMFSQSLLSLNKFEEFLSQRPIPNTDQTWEKNVNYYRTCFEAFDGLRTWFISGLDGGTNGLEREKLINAFNAPQSNVKLFLLSTR
jgi:hypothetical protein